MSRGMSVRGVPANQNMKPRGPIVTILGHVDHGKTTLLDYIRKTKVTEKEHGGITQRIGAYEISSGIKGYPTDKITFIDTPGHEAFSKLRARGATVADIALLIVDAKDSLMPQTEESIQHIKASKTPFIVVANKTDLPDAAPDKIKIDLMKHSVLVEGRGGDVPFVEISAKTGKGVSELLETILLLASHSALEYDPDAAPEAYVIETHKDKRGVVVSALIKNGVIKRGQKVYSEGRECKVRALTNDRGIQVAQVEPSTPFEILGFNELPTVGSLLTESETANLQAAAPETQKKAFNIQSVLHTPTAEKRRLAVIIKADAHGSLEAINQTLEKNPAVDIILSSVGDINNADIFLAKSTKAIVIGFNTKPTGDVQELAKHEKVVVKTYNIIYDLLEELAEVAHLLQEKEEQEKSVKGEAKIAATFVIEGETVFGVRVTKGKVNTGDHADLYRDAKKLGSTRLVSLRSRAKPVSEAKKDQEAGMLFEPKLDIKVGDVIKFIP